LLDWEEQELNIEKESRIGADLSQLFDHFNCTRIHQHNTEAYLCGPGAFLTLQIDCLIVTTTVATNVSFICCEAKYIYF
jgi:hypothetical protein